MRRRITVISLLSLSAITALLGFRYMTEPTYKLDVNFDGVSTTPDWPFVTRIFYELIPEDYGNQRFGLALCAGNEGCMNRTPTVPAGPCEIAFSEVRTTTDSSSLWLSGKLRLKLPRTKSEKTLRVDAKECPDVVAIAATDNNRMQDNEIQHSAETDTFYTADVSKEIEVPFNEGKATIYLIYKLPERWEYVTFGICRLP